MESTYIGSSIVQCRGLAPAVLRCSTAMDIAPGDGIDNELEIIAQHETLQTAVHRWLKQVPI